MLTLLRIDPRYVCVRTTDRWSGLHNCHMCAANFETWPRTVIRWTALTGLGDSAMAKLTLNTPGGYPPRQAEFAPPKRESIPKWAIAGGAVLFLTMFTGLVVTTTLLVSQSSRTDAAALATARALLEPAYPDPGNQVARQQVSLLQTVAATPAPTPAPAVPVGAAAPEAAPVPEVAAEPVTARTIEVAAVTPTQLGLGAAHRYRVPSCVDYLETLVKITTVNFPLGSDEPSEADMIRARNIATAVKTCDEVAVIVEGHSDRRGSAQLNMDLSWLRARSVIDQLEHEGFDISAMQPLGFGAKRPINLSGTVSGEAVNRRVQFALAPRSGSTPQPIGDN